MAYVHWAGFRNWLSFQRSKRTRGRESGSGSPLAHSNSELMLCCQGHRHEGESSLWLYNKVVKKSVSKSCVLNVTNYAKPHLDLWPFLEPDLGEERLVAALQPSGHGRAQFERPTKSSRPVGPPPTGRGTRGRVSLSCVVGPRSADP